LDELAPFDPEKKIIEYVLRGEQGGRLVDQTLEGFTHETASESVAPGGGSVAAAVGALGAALGTMVANLSSHKRGWDDRWEEFSDWAERGKASHEELLHLVDADTDAFNQIMAAFGLPQKTDEEKAARAAAIEAATVGAIEIPFRTMEVALESMDVIAAMAATGLPASASDAGVAALCARTAVLGAYLNVLINAKELTDAETARGFVGRGAELRDRAIAREIEILETLSQRF
jgi:glutamate formiminotransferase/formiminotetrahydrofolate cyclodeaminase